MSAVDTTVQTPTIAFAHWHQQITGNLQGVAQFVAAVVAWVFQRVTGMKDHTSGFICFRSR